MIKPNGEILPPLKCATCPVSCGCAWDCLRGDDLAEIYTLRAALDLAEDVLKTVQKVYGPSPLITMTLAKTGAAISAADHASEKPKSDSG